MTQSATDYDRPHMSCGASHRRKPFIKGSLLGRFCRTKSSLNSKLHVVCDPDARSIKMLLTEGQLNVHVGARLMFRSIPKAQVLMPDKGCDSNEFRQALQRRGIDACIPPRQHRKVIISCDRKLYKTRHKIENLYAKLKDWYRIATRDDRCAHTFISAICIAGAVAFYFNH